MSKNLKRAGRYFTVEVGPHQELKSLTAYFDPERERAAWWFAYFHGTAGFYKFVILRNRYGRVLKRWRKE